MVLLLGLDSNVILASDAMPLHLLHDAVDADFASLTTVSYSLKSV